MDPPRIPRDVPDPARTMADEIRQQHLRPGKLPPREATEQDAARKPAWLLSKRRQGDHGAKREPEQIAAVDPQMIAERHKVVAQSGEVVSCQARAVADARWQLIADAGELRLELRHRHHE